MSMGRYSDAFKGTAYYYSRYRPPYPEEFFDLIRNAFRLDGRGRLLDLGCGTGHIAVPLSRHFEETVGMDPEPEMLAEAERVIAEAGADRVQLVRGGSSDLLRLIGILGTFRLVTMGSSFHWMAREATLEVLSRMVEPGGGIVIASAGSLWSAGEPWCREVKAIVQRWLGEQRRAGSATFSGLVERHEDIIDRSSFGPCETHIIRYRQAWTVDTVIGYLYSTSFCSPTVLGDNRQAFEQDLRNTLTRLEPSGRFIEDVTLEVHLGRLK